MTDYEMLKASGHSPAIAAQILLDFKRGTPLAVFWMSVVRDAFKGQDNV